MKPKIDLNNALVQDAIKYYENEVRKALSVPQRVEHAVVPLYIIPERKAHENRAKKPIQNASGVIVKLKGEFFIFSANHSFLPYGEFGIMTGSGSGEPIQNLIGERFSTSITKNQDDDKIDASVFHIQSEISDSLKNLAITLDDIDIDNNDNNQPIYITSGFRSKISNTTGNTANSRLESLPSFELESDAYSLLNIDIKAQIILAYEMQAFVEGRWQISPSPRGMSGGAIIKVQGTNIKPSSKENKNTKQLLSAIFIERRYEKKGGVGCLLGTRIHVHLQLIHHFIPGLLDDIFI